MAGPNVTLNVGLALGGTHPCGEVVAGACAFWAVVFGAAGGVDETVGSGPLFGLAVVIVVGAKRADVEVSAAEVVCALMSRGWAHDARNAKKAFVITRSFGLPMFVTTCP